jgi:pullulanase/glycogen debranching enzyme
LISRGVPTLLGGDEVRRTQRGNDNAYCQDNAISWYDWRSAEQHREIHCFTRGMTAFRRAHPVLSREQFYTDAEIRWLGPRGGLPNWADPKEKQVACLIREDELHRLSPFDPEHLPEEILSTEAFYRRFPDLPQVACFDTAFHHDLPRVARLLPIPRRYEAQGMRR